MSTINVNTISPQSGSNLNVTSTKFTGSLLSTASFGRVQATTLGGNSPIEIDGEITGTISGSITSTASFGTYIGDGGQLSGIETLQRTGSDEVSGSARVFGPTRLTGSLIQSGGMNVFASASFFGHDNTSAGWASVNSETGMLNVSMSKDGADTSHGIVIRHHYNETGTAYPLLIQNVVGSNKAYIDYTGTFAGDKIQFDMAGFKGSIDGDSGPGGNMNFVGNSRGFSFTSEGKNLLSMTGKSGVSTLDIAANTTINDDLLVTGSIAIASGSLTGSLVTTASLAHLKTVGDVVFSGSKHDMNGELNLHGGSSNAFVVKALYGDGSLNADFTFRNPLGSANGGALGIRGYYLGVNSKILSLGANTGAEYWSFTGTVFSGSDHSITKLGHITASGDIHMTGTGSFSGSITSTGSFGKVNIADSIGKLSRITSSFTVDTGPATSAKITGKSFSNFILEWKNQSNNTVYSDHKLSAQGHDLGLYYGGSNDILRLRESNAIYHRWKTTNYVASHDAFEYSSSRTSIHKLGAISASGDITIDGSGSLTVAGDIRTSGDVIAQNLIVSSSITHMTTSFSSGSTLFGDTIDDTHEFTGSLNITGSVTLSGSLNASGHNAFVNRLYIGPDTTYGNNIRYGSPAGNIGFFRGDTQFIKFFRHSDGRGIIFASGGPGFLTYPTYTFDADFDTGMANPAHNNLGFYAHAAEIVRINGSGLEVKSGNISGSITCSITVGATGSFGKLIGDGSDLTGISSFAGAAGTETLFSGSITSTGSFDNLKLNNFDFQGVDSTPATSVIIGDNAFSYANDTASENDNNTVVAIGSNCIEQVVRTRQSVYIGSSVLQNFAGEVYRISGNVIIGNQAGRYMTAVSNVTVLGSSAGQTTLGANSVMIGSEANAGQYATAVGYQAGGQENNVSIGAFAGANLGGNGVYVGYEAGAGINNGSADQNTFLGGRAGKTDTAGSSLTNTSNTICIGWDTHATAGGTNEIVIGANAEGKGSNTTVIGNSSQTKVIFSGNAIISGSLTSTGSFGKLLGDGSGLTNLPGGGGGIFADSSSYQGTQNNLQITGSVDITGSFSATAKSFVIPHPAKDQGFLQHGSLEGPEHGVYVRGHLKDDNEIILPDYWDPLVDESTISVQLTPIGTWQQLFVKEVSNSKVVVQNRLDGHSIDCYYVVQGERKDIPKIELEL